MREFTGFLWFFGTLVLLSSNPLAPIIISPGLITENKSRTTGMCCVQLRPQKSLEHDCTQYSYVLSLCAVRTTIWASQRFSVESVKCQKKRPVNKSQSQMRCLQIGCFVWPSAKNPNKFSLRGEKLEESSESSCPRSRSLHTFWDFYFVNDINVWFQPYSAGLVWVQHQTVSSGPTDGWVGPCASTRGWKRLLAAVSSTNISRCSPLKLLSSQPYKGDEKDSIYAPHSCEK